MIYLCRISFLFISCDTCKYVNEVLKILVTKKMFLPKIK